MKSAIDPVQEDKEKELMKLDEKKVYKKVISVSKLRMLGVISVWALVCVGGVQKGYAQGVQIKEPSQKIPSRGTSPVQSVAPAHSFNEQQWRTQWMILRQKTVDTVNRLMVYQNGKSSSPSALDQFSKALQEQIVWMNQALPVATSGVILDGYEYLFQMHALWGQYFEIEKNPSILQGRAYQDFITQWAQLERSWKNKVMTLGNKKIYAPAYESRMNKVMYQSELWKAHSALWWQSVHAHSAIEWMALGQTEPLRVEQYAFSVDQCRHLGAYWGSSVQEYIKKRSAQWELKKQEQKGQENKDLNEEGKLIQRLQNNRALGQAQCEQASTQGVMMASAFGSKLWGHKP